MPLNQTALSAAIKSAFDSAASQTTDPESARQQIADSLAAAIVSCIETGTVTVIGVTAGGATATGTIS